jgi:hypothetical protein
MLTIHESFREDGTRESVDVGSEDGALAVRVAGETTLLPMDVFVAVMKRYGKPVEAAVPIDGPSVDLGETGSLTRIRSIGFYDVIGKDYLVWSPRDGEPHAELATAVSAAIVHFVTAVRGCV